MCFYWLITLFSCLSYCFGCLVNWKIDLLLLLLGCRDLLLIHRPVYMLRIRLFRLNQLKTRRDFSFECLVWCVRVIRRAVYDWLTEGQALLIPWEATLFNLSFRRWLLVLLLVNNLRLGLWNLVYSSFRFCEFTFENALEHFRLLVDLLYQIVVEYEVFVVNEFSAEGFPLRGDALLAGRSA